MKLKPVPSARRSARDLPRSDDQIETDQQPASDVRGLIDNATADRLYGWAWDASYPGTRLKVELRLAGEVVANTIADFVRPDLARTGVGDGCHAFEFPLVPAWIERRSELTAVAFGADGTEFPIAMRLRRTDEGGPATAAQLLRALESLQGEQEAIRAEFAALRDNADRLPDAGAVAAIRDAQETLQRKVEQLELWLTRLDGRLGEADLISQGGGSGRLDKWQAVLIAALASASSAAMAVIIARFYMGP
jgi:uncharacterized protein YhfF